MKRTRSGLALIAALAAAAGIACSSDRTPTGATPAAGPSLHKADYDTDGDGRLSVVEKATKKAAEEGAEAQRRIEKEEFELAVKDWKAYKKAVKEGRVAVDLLRCEPQKRVVVQKRIGRKGGDINIGKHKLVVPEGALSEEVEITAVSSGSSLVDLQFEPHGLHFNEPVQLTLSYEHCILPDAYVNSVVYLGNGNQILEFPPSVDDADADEVTALTDHFSGYAVATRR
jgi:hypothetical protein